MVCRNYILSKLFSEYFKKLDVFFHFNKFFQPVLLSLGGWLAGATFISAQIAIMLLGFFAVDSTPGPDYKKDKAAFFR